MEGVGQKVVKRRGFNRYASVSPVLKSRPKVVHKENIVSKTQFHLVQNIKKINNK